YEGSDRPLNQQEPYLAVAQKVHGNDGLANKLEAYDVVTEEKQTGEAISFIIDKVKKYPNEVTLIFVGPLTNLAKVYEQAPEVATLVKEIIVMGDRKSTRLNSSHVSISYAVFCLKKKKKEKNK